MDSEKKKKLLDISHRAIIKAEGRVKTTLVIFGGSRYGDVFR